MCTGWLARECLARSLAKSIGGPDAEVPGASDVNGADVSMPLIVEVWLHQSQSGTFRVPRDLGVPWVMIGPGTGVAPFRGFLQHRCGP